MTDQKGCEVPAQIGGVKQRKLQQDLEDVLISQSRRREKRIPLEEVKEGLIKSGKLSRGSLSGCIPPASKPQESQGGYNEASDARM